jgi:hypothetical protein
MEEGKSVADDLKAIFEAFKESMPQNIALCQDALEKTNLRGDLRTQGSSFISQMVLG